MSIADPLTISALGERPLPTPMAVPPQIQSFLPTVTSLVPTTISLPTPIAEVTPDHESSGNNRALIIILSCAVAALLLLLIIFAIHRYRQIRSASEGSSQDTSSIEEAQSRSEMVGSSQPNPPQGTGRSGRRGLDIILTQGDHQVSMNGSGANRPPQVPVPVHASTYPRVPGNNRPQEVLEVDIRDPVPMYTRRSKTLWRGSGGQPRRPERSEGSSTPPLYGAHQQHPLVQSSPTSSTSPPALPESSP
ncbi:hypothetical protein BJ684DRAFT_16716 [Piptocephalis cylindrospora]|uniref:Uncharacterized protein n=1 Tax=Piptocephalis cylindrospora TaxID=1907219 RepID=A0A4P9Y3Y2_9FUNG|nr:hypothetical protein BJ684DRAFT_16716 [Piptocephalis cylindrospora]|eukprot:RKP12831.1 hypothetical protein BJ684DRAFT_16716 [Piptocephalis cylindrospora]